MNAFNSPALLSGPHHRSLTGFRGLAALLVLCFHYFDGLHIFRFGWLGVDMLFVLTGFLITGRLLETRHLPNSTFQFLKNRFLRIVPLCFLLLAAYFWVLPALLPAGLSHVAQQSRVNSVNSPWYFSFLQNWLFVTNGYPAIPMLAFLWSLSIQVQFYLLAAFLLNAVQNIRSLKIILGALAIAGFMLRVNIRFECDGENFTPYMYNTLARMDSFCAGALAYIYVREQGLKKEKLLQRLAVIVSLLIMTLFVIMGTVDFRNVLNSTLGIALFALLTAIVLCLLLQTQNNWSSRFFSNRFLCFTGHISYSLYLYHVIIFALFSGYMHDGFSRLTGAGLPAETLAALTSMALSYAVAWASYRFLEQPLLKMKMGGR
jgi:peptidoglycan/LPS O-acetylase OafA/YrhL